MDTKSTMRAKEAEKDTFRAFEKVRQSGVFNMITQAADVMKAADLTNEQYISIINNYDYLKEKYFLPIYIDIQTGREKQTILNMVGNENTIPSDNEEASREAHEEDVNERYLRSIYEEGSPEWDMMHYEY